MSIGKRVIEIAMKNGATLAGIASMRALKVSASHTIYNKIGDFAATVKAKDDQKLPDDQLFADADDLLTHRLFSWPDSVKSVLVIGLSHPEEKPELDWWDGRGTLGNRLLIDIIKRTSQQIENSLYSQTIRISPVSFGRYDCRMPDLLVIGF